MLIVLMGESCTGKTTLADKITDLVHAEVYSGKDYLRLAKNENEAKKLFCEKLSSAVTGSNIIYMITEQEHLAFLPKGAFRILLTADLETIKERFAARMHGNLPTPLAAMLEKKHGCFDREACHVHVHNGDADMAEISRALKDFESGAL